MEKVDFQEQGSLTPANEGGRYLRVEFNGKVLEREADFTPPDFTGRVVEVTLIADEIKDFDLQIGSEVMIVDKPGSHDFQREGIPPEEERTPAIIIKIKPNGPPHYTVRALG